ncbi:angiopoietin-1 receptor-like [Patiria miniata]|uniref:receptor protein-tyrosine kinase n=1 Tax=Patiria miniata TaxID=46514 RepID=A0A913Z919_PATMI|nr:angiopoietin-1 receptor-like [Patiria miniata]
MASVLRSDRIGVMLLLMDACLLSGVVSLNVTGKPATQSSTAPDNDDVTYVAGKAVDGDLSTFTHTGYNPPELKTDPWWRLDLEAIYCLRTITIYNRQNYDCGKRPPNNDCARRIIGAVIRAGLNQDHLTNREIGTVTEAQAIDRTRPIEIIANPMVTAHFVSVDIPGTNNILHMREVEVGEYLDEGGDGEVDFTLVANPALLGQTGDDDAIIAAYKGPNDISADVSFGRQVITGGSNDLPSGSNQLQDPLLGCQVRQLNLPEQGGIDRTGVFYCEATRAGRTNTKILTVILPKDETTVHIRPAQRTQVASVGDSVRLEMRNVHAPNTNYRWRHNGGDVMTSWDDQLSVSIDDVAVSDGGVYSCFASGQEDQQLHGIMTLIVQGCSSGKWGSASSPCLNVCRRCYNGGVCDAKIGSCTCAPGFSGEQCEQVRGRNVFGKNGVHNCSAGGDHDYACRGRLFCLPDPYGCSCAAGFTGLDCMQECAEGKYGADCTQTCHCAGICSKDTGECTNGANCDSSYFGNNCQCSNTEPFTGEVKSTSIMQRSLGFSWSEPKCGGQPDPPVTGYRYKLSGRVSGQQPPFEFDTPDTSVSLDELIPYVEYSFKVAAITSEGTGTYSNSVVVRTAEAEPTVPLNVNIQNVSEDSITVGWMKPDPPQGNITAYEATWTLGDGTPAMQDIGIIVAYRIKGLLLNSTYDVQVRAKTVIGPGPWSEAIRVTVVGVPGPLQNLRWTNRTEEAVTLDWDLPLKPKGPISGYVVQHRAIEKPYQPDFTPTDTFIENETASAPFVQDNLEPSTIYEFIVSAKNQWHMGVPQLLQVYTKQNKRTTNAQNNGPNVAAIVLGVLLTISGIVNIISCVVWRKRDQDSAPTKLLDDQEIELSLVRDPNMHAINRSPIAENDIEKDIYENVGLPVWAKGLEIQWRNLTIEDKVLGKGNFGEVRAGSLKIRGGLARVAIKTLKGATTTASEDFLVEFKTMAQIKPHPNVVGLMGACMHEAFLYVALEYLPNGNLRDYLRSTRPKQQVAGKSDDGVSPLTSSNLLTFGIDIARGMDHLSDTGIIHRDLAARNILLGDDLTAKISDFGLSRGEDVYVQKSQTRVPFRWLAIESLTRRVYKSKSDVWSFGVVLWEIATFGATPYPGIQSKLLAERLQEGYRLPKPENCADEIYDLMMRCWQPQPSQRPSFKELMVTLKKMNDPSDENIYMTRHIYENHVIKPEFDDN